MEAYLDKKPTIIIDFDQTITQEHTHNNTLNEIRVPVKTGGIQNWAAEEIREGGALDRAWNSMEKKKLLEPTGSDKQWEEIFKTLIDNGYPVAIASFNSFGPNIKRYLKEKLKLEDYYVDKIRIEAWMPADPKIADKNHHIDRIIRNIPVNQAISESDKLSNEERAIRYKRDFILIDDSEKNISGVSQYRGFALKVPPKGSDNPEIVKNELNRRFGIFTAKKSTVEEEDAKIKELRELRKQYKQERTRPKLGEGTTNVKESLAQNPFYQLLDNINKDVAGIIEAYGKFKPHSSLSNLKKNLDKLKSIFAADPIKYSDNIKESFQALEQYVIDSFNEWKIKQQGRSSPRLFNFISNKSQPKGKNLEFSDYINWLNRDDQIKDHHSTRMIGNLLNKLYKENKTLLPNVFEKETTTGLNGNIDRKKFQSALAVLHEDEKLVRRYGK